MFETLGFNPDSPLLKHVRFFSFPKEVKRTVRQEQDNICFSCGEKVKEVEVHHRLPQCLGGSDRVENAVGLCSGEHGKGENSPDDCHEKFDRLAIDSNLFLHPDGRLVTRDEMPNECFKYENHGMPQRRQSNERHKTHIRRKKYYSNFHRR